MTDGSGANGRGGEAKSGDERRCGDKGDAGGGEAKGDEGTDGGEKIVEGDDNSRAGAGARGGREETERGIRCEGAEDDGVLEASSLYSARCVVFQR